MKTKALCKLLSASALIALGSALSAQTAAVVVDANAPLHPLPHSFWIFDDVCEEGGVKPKPFDGAFGPISMDKISKPWFYDFALLHKLGDERLANAADNVLVTRRKDGAMGVPASSPMAQAEALNQASSLPAPERTTLHDGKLQLTLPVNGLAVLDVSSAK